MRGDMFVFVDTADNTCKAILDVLEAGELESWKVEVKGIAIVQFGVYE